MREFKSEKDFLKTIASMNPVDDAERNQLACTLLGNSLINTTCFGYYYCARCGDQVGDNLGSFYANAEKCVVVGHKCDVCVANFEALDWRHKVFCPDPFADDLVDALEAREGEEK